MNAASQTKDVSDSREQCNIVVIYDGNETRTRAMSACDYLVSQFWEDVELDFHWWRTDFLRDAALAQAAANDAVAADFIILCSGTEQQLPPLLEGWFATWLEQRGHRLGAMVDLGTVRNAQNIPSAPRRELFLREVCQRGSFDYLTSFDPRHSSPDARQTVGGMIDDILGDSRPPTHYGLNE